MTRRTPRSVRHRRLAVAAAIAATALVLQLQRTQPAVSQALELDSYQVSDEGDLIDPSASAWRRASSVDLPLTAQQAAWPMGGGSVPMLEARALHTDTMLYLRVSWTDDTEDSEAVAVDQFVDAAAIEFPAVADSSVPALCMGQSDSGVNIWHWQAGRTDGRADTIEELSANGYVDRYPSTDDLYFPARAAGNPVAAPAAMSDLVAVGFGTLAPASDQNLQGRADYADGRWQVVFARELSDESVDQIDLDTTATADIAFAVWDGSAGERNGKKSVSQFVVLALSPEGPPGRGTGGVAVVVALAIGATIIGGALLLQSMVDNRPVDSDTSLDSQ